MLWRVHTELADRPRALAVLERRCGGSAVDVVDVQTRPGGLGDELILSVPDGWGSPEVTEFLEGVGGDGFPSPRTAHLRHDNPGRYPQPASRLIDEPAADGSLPDGGTATDTGRRDDPVLRLGLPGDADAVIRMHERCSMETMHRRYHAPMPRLRRSLAARLVSPPDGLSVLAEADGEIAGMAVVVPYAPDTMEIALVVEDAWQRRGLGSRLMQQAARLAKGRGARRAICLVQPDNRRLLRTLHRAGLQGHVCLVDDVMEVTVDLRRLESPMAPQTGAAMDGQGDSRRRQAGMTRCDDEEKSSHLPGTGREQENLRSHEEEWVGTGRSPAAHQGAMLTVHVDAPARGIGLVAPQGEIDLLTAPLLVERVTPELPTLDHVVIDLTQTTFLACRGVQAILRLDDEARRHRCRLHLAGDPPRTVARVLEITGVTRTHPINVCVGALVTQLVA